MSGVETTVRGAVRALFVAVAAALAALVAASGSSACAEVAATAARPVRCPTPHEVYSAHLFVEHKNRKIEDKALFLVCQPNHVARIVDWAGGAYDDLDDFRAHNHVLRKDDKIIVSRIVTGDASAAIGSTATPGLVTLSGHTRTSSWRPELVGGIVLVLLVGGVVLAWLVMRRRRTTPPAPATDQPLTGIDQDD